MTIEIRIQLRSEWTVGFVVENGKNRMKEYLDGLLKSKNEKAFTRVMTGLDRFSRHGPLHNIGKFRHEGGGVYAIKESQERIYGFFSGQRFFACAAGTSKKSQKPDKEILAIVRRLKKEYESS